MKVAPVLVEKQGLARLRQGMLPFARPDITQEEIDAVTRVLVSGWLTSGPEVLAFEEDFKKVVQAKYTLAVNSATAGLHLAMVVNQVSKGDAVIVPSITFTATAEVVQYSGAIPLIVDVDRQSYLLDFVTLEKFVKEKCLIRKKVLIHKKTGARIKGIMAVHLAGNPCDLDAIQKFAKMYNLFVVEDAAHSFPSTYKGQPIGNGKNICVFSFYATKNLCTAEGGMIATNNRRFAERMKRLRLHGIQGQTYGRKRWKYDVRDIGYKYNMSDINAAMGRVQLEKSDSMLEKRKRISSIYDRELAGLKGISLPKFSTGSSYHLYTIEIDPTIMDRNRFVEEMYARGISTSLHFIPLYRHSYYKKTYKLTNKDFPVSEEIYKRIVSIPFYSAMSDNDIIDVIDAIKDILG